MFLGRMQEFLLGSNVDMSLPQHVKNAIKQQQITSEKLISWLQLFVWAIFVLLYVIAPKAYPSTVTFTPIPWALGLYLIFTLIRLFLSHQEYLSTWFLMLSSIIDICLLIILIWSFHLQYHQPIAFSLKIPTIMYLLIFISLRALRLETKYILITGIAAAIGWLILLIDAISTSPPGTMTHSFVLYINSNHIMLDVEFNKIITIILITLILTLVVARGRRLLISGVAETIAAKELSKFFEPELAERIIEAGQEIKPGYGELRSVAIIHCDIRGFTEMAKHTDASVLMQLLTEYQTRVVNVIEAYHGSIDKFLGDGILASFNAVKNDVAYVADALRAADKIIATNLAWGKKRQSDGLTPIKIGVTVSIGQAILGIVGNASRLEYTVIGNPVNEAAKLDKHCKVEHCQVLITEDAFIKAIEQGYQPSSHIEKLPNRQVSGITGLINLVVLER